MERRLVRHGIRLFWRERFNASTHRNRVAFMYSNPQITEYQGNGPGWGYKDDWNLKTTQMPDNR